MRSFDPDFQAELDRDNPDVFHGVEIDTGTETIRVAKRKGGAEFGGNEYVEALAAVTPMASRADAADKALDEQQINATISNLPTALPSGGRLSRRLPITVEGNSARLDLFAYTEHNADGTPVLESLKRENLFVGTPHFDDLGWTIDEATLRLEPLLKKHLGKAICDAITASDYPFARTADVGKAIPIVFGSVRDFPGRVTKARSVSVPVPGENNVGSATLGRPSRGNTDPAARTYTVTIGTAEAVAFTTAADTEPTISTNWGTGIAVARAQSFSMSAAHPVAGVKVRLREAGSSTKNHYVRVGIYANSGGNPPSSMSSPLAQGTVLVTLNAAAAWYTVLFSSPVSLSGSTTYWIVCRSNSAVLNEHLVVGWGAVAAGGYANGSAREGIGEEQATSFTWQSAGAHDHNFEVILADDSPTFSVDAFPGGAQGSGTVGSDFTASNDEVFIPGTAWSGDPAAGDTFEFETVAGENEIVFSSSPLATPIRSVANIKWNGAAVPGATITQLTSSTSSGATVSATEARAQSFTVEERMLAGHIRFRATNSSASGPLIAEIVASDPTSGLPSGQALGSLSFTVSGTQEVQRYFTESVLLEPGVYWLVLRTEAPSGSYAIFYSTLDPYAGGRAANFTSGAWSFGTSTTDYHFEIGAVVLIVHNTAVNAAGQRVAHLLLDREIPDDVVVTADLEGLIDDSSGTYTGVAESTITIPADVMHFLASRAGLPAANIDLAADESFAVSRAAAAGVQRFNGAFDTAGQTVLNGMLDWAFQAHSVLDWSGDKLEFRYLAPDPPSLATLGWGDVVDENQGDDGPRRPAIRGGRTKAEEWIINRITLRYDRDWSKAKGAAAYRRSEQDQDDDSIAAYGERAKDELFLCDAITTEAMALDTLGYWLAARAYQTEEIDVVHPLSWARLEKGDVVQFDLPEDDEGAIS